MTLTIARLAVLSIALAAAPSARAGPALLCIEDATSDLDDAGDFFQALGYQVALGDCPDFESCDGLNLLVADEEACASDDGPGCSGVTVLVSSPRSCVAGAGDVGCEGVQVVDPLSSGSCVGGGGDRLFALLA